MEMSVEDILKEADEELFLRKENINSIGPGLELKSHSKDGINNPFLTNVKAKSKREILKDASKSVRQNDEISLSKMSKDSTAEYITKSENAENDYSSDEDDCIEGLDRPFLENEKHLHFSCYNRNILEIKSLIKNGQNHLI